MVFGLRDYHLIVSFLAMLSLRPLALVLALFFPADIMARATEEPVPSYDRAYDHALAIVLKGDSTAIVDKRVGPIRAIATSHDDNSRDLVDQAVGAINDAFGYGKIALSWSDSARLEDDAVTIYIGPKTEGRQLIERFGVSSPRAFRSSMYHYWWEKERPNYIRRCLITVDSLLPKERQLEDLRYMLFACVGLKSPWSAEQAQRAPRSSDSLSVPALSEFDNAIIRFFDKHVQPGARAWEMRRAFKREWPDFSAAYYNPDAKSESREPAGVGSRPAP